MATLAFPFDCIPQAATLDATLSDCGYRVYASLVAAKNRRTGQCNPKETTLASRLGKGLRTIQRAIAELRSVGMITSRRTLTGNHYDISTPNQWRLSSDPPKMADADPPKMAAGSRQKRRSDGVSSLYEPDVLEPEENAAAAVKVSTVVQEASASAAAVADASLKTNANAGAAAAAAELVDELIREHPEPGRPDAAVREAQKALAAAPDLQEACATARRNHALYLAYWATLDPHRFIPQLARWFASGEWKYPPAQRRGVQRETGEQRRKREMDEYTEKLYRSFAESEMWGALRENGQDPEVWRAKVQAA